jgi:hypothetical protein
MSMMEEFSAGSNLRLSMERPGCPQILERCMPIVRANLDQEVRGTLMSSENPLDDHMDAVPSVKKRRKNKTKLEDEIHDALEAHLRSEGNLSMATDAINHSQYETGSRRYAPRDANLRNSVIFFQPRGEEELVPGIIRRIFTIQNDSSPTGQDVFLAVHRYHPLDGSESFENPFADFPDYGASFWREQLRDEVEVIWSTQNICHGNQRHWNGEIVIMRPTHHVRPPSS